MVNDSADVTPFGRTFQVCGPATGKDQQYSDRRLDKSATRVKGPRYPGASPWTTLYVIVHQYRESIYWAMTTNEPHEDITKKNIEIRTG